MQRRLKTVATELYEKNDKGSTTSVSGEIANVGLNMRRGPSPLPAKTAGLWEARAALHMS